MSLTLLSRWTRRVVLHASPSKSHSINGSSVQNLLRLESTTSAASPVRQTVSKEERAARRAARKERSNAFISSMIATEGAEVAEKSAHNAVAAVQEAQKAVIRASASGPTFDVTRVGWYAAVLIPTAFIGWGIVDENSPLAKLSRMVGLTKKIEEYAKPARNKLLPDWNKIPNVPPDMTPPLTLVLDLENTLVCSTWDRKYGWRHAKRPGVDKFLATMFQYYEIVIFTPSPDSLAMPVIDALDSKGHVLHRLFRDSTNYHNGVHCKDLSWLNRNLHKVVALDDDSEALQFQPENLIQVKSYDDPKDREDDTLERITPLLIEMSREGYDVPEVLSQFRGMDADEIANEHERRVNELRARRQQVGRWGLGSFASSRVSLPPPELPPSLHDSGGGQHHQLTAKDLVGIASPLKKNKSGVIGWWHQRQKQQKEQNKEKFDLWNEVMMKRQAEKKKKMDETR